MQKRRKATLVILGAILFSTVAIQAGDVVRNIDGNMLGSALSGTGSSVCDEGAVEVFLSSGRLCVDLYEASPATSCPVSNPGTAAETQENMNEFACSAVSKSKAMPWRYVSMQQAQQLCGRVGKRLPNNDEWYALASGMGDQTACNTARSGAIPAGSEKCVTHAGVYDMIGNVWEWVDAEVVDGVYNNRPVPVSGYVHLVDADGVVLETGIDPNNEYGADYALTKGSGVLGMIRGGFYDSGSDAGLYAQNMAVALDLKAAGVGFRCVQSI